MEQASAITVKKEPEIAAYFTSSSKTKLGDKKENVNEAKDIKFMEASELSDAASDAEEKINIAETDELKILCQTNCDQENRPTSSSTCTNLSGQAVPPTIQTGRS